MISFLPCIHRLQRSSNPGISPCLGLSPGNIQRKLSRMSVRFLRRDSGTPRKTRKLGRRNIRRKSSWNRCLYSIVRQPWNWASISHRSIRYTSEIFPQLRQTMPSVRGVLGDQGKPLWWFLIALPKVPTINGSSITRMRWSMVP